MAPLDKLPITVEAGLGAEMEAHLGYSPHEITGNKNSRNDYSSKTLKGDHGQIVIDTPRDRNGRFKPAIVSKGQTCITGMDDQILSLFARGMSTRDIVAAFQDMYGADISAGLVSTVTNAVMVQVPLWCKSLSDKVGVEKSPS